MRIFLLSAALAISLFLPGCARRSFQSQTLVPAALATHRTVAILPFTVGLERLQDVVIRGPEPWTDSVRRPLALTHGPNRQRWGERRQLGYQLQAELQAALMRQQVTHPITVAFQNPADTNQRLARAGITYESLPSHSMAELRAALGVDVVLLGQTDMRQLLPGSASIALFVLTDSNLMAANGVRTALDLYDTQTGQLVWRFDHELAGRPSTSPVALANALVRHMWRGFPYVAKP
ncbi:hypothetical protein [Hymenobacter sp. UYCo722]|uniref:hypothetical protein n=1 Tax=Hymenobacter sp. UYCo722 TaxID=3156335 RepID=UPI003399DCBB